MTVAELIFKAIIAEVTRQSNDEYEQPFVCSTDEENPDHHIYILDGAFDIKKLTDAITRTIDDNHT